MKSIAELVLSRRKELGLSQDKLAEMVGTSQATIDKIENGRSLRSKFLPQIFAAIDLPLEAMVQAREFQPLSSLTGQDVTERDTLSRRYVMRAPKVSASNLVGEVDLPIYTSVRAGAIDDSILVSPDPIDYVKRPEPLSRAKNGYGLYIVGDSMEPVFRQGDLALVHPNLPAKAGDEVVVCSVDADGEHYAVIKLLTKVTADKWHLRQYNPDPGEPHDFTLDRSEWPICHLVVGSYRRR